MTQYQKLILVRQAQRMLPFVTTIRSKPLKMFFVLLCAPISVFFLIPSRKKPIIPYLELAITEKCSLRCESCANLMPYYCSPQNTPLEKLTEQMDALLSKVSALWVLQLLGGEPLLHPQLEALLTYLIATPKIKEIQVVTNGTLTPRPEILEKLKSRKVIVLISNYGRYSRKLDTLPELFAKNGIRYRLLNYSEWMDYGGLEKRNLSHEELLRSFAECASAGCKTLLEGRIYSCPRSAHMANLGLLPRERDSISVFDGQDFANKLLRFYNVSTIAACDHCNPVWARPAIPAGEQLPAGECLPLPEKSPRAERKA